MSRVVQIVSATNPGGTTSSSCSVAVNVGTGQSIYVVMAYYNSSGGSGVAFADSVGSTSYTDWSSAAGTGLPAIWCKYVDNAPAGLHVLTISSNLNTDYGLMIMAMVIGMVSAPATLGSHGSPSGAAALNAAITYTPSAGHTASELFVSACSFFRLVSNGAMGLFSKNFPTGRIAYVACGSSNSYSMGLFVSFGSVQAIGTGVVASIADAYLDGRTLATPTWAYVEDGTNGPQSTSTSVGTLGIAEDDEGTGEERRSQGPSLDEFARGLK